ncbi:CHAT domain-containing protein [Rugosimonospora acidiphila]|uniref:CHAT domain-containing protein n=1 Tax=Rugosimonospora acidiphila TaxID=556531 RepID=A0ABP9RRS4_9ACTN
MSSSALEQITALLEEYERTGEPETLGVDTSEQQRVLGAAVGDRGAGRAAARTLATLHWYRYLVLPGLDGLRERRAAVDLYRRLARKDPDAVPELIRDECRDGAGTGLDDLSAVLLSPQQAARVDRLWQRHGAGDAKALGLLISLHQEWLRSVKEQRDRPGVLLRAALLTDLTDALVAFARASRNGTEYAAALDCAEKAVAATTARDPHRPARLTRHGLMLELCFDSGAGPRALELAVDSYRRAAQLSWRSRPTDLNCASRLGSALSRLHEIPGRATVGSLIEAVATWRDVLISTDPGDQELQPRLDRLNAVANLLVERVGVDVVETIVNAAQEPETIDRLFRRCQELTDRMDFDTSLQDERLDTAMMLFAAVPAFHPDRPDALLLLGDAEFDRWQYGGDLDGAACAMTWAHTALDAAGPEHPLRRRILNRLAGAAGTVGLQTRDEDLVEVALNAARTALELTDEQSEHRATQLGVLGDAYARAGRLAGSPELMDEAVRHQREAVAHTPAGHDVDPARLMSLAGALVERDLLAPDDALLAEAVAVNRRALAAVRQDDPRRVGFLFNLAASLQQHAVRRGDLADLLEVERLYQDAFALLPSGHPDEPRIRSSIASGRYERYLVGGDLDALTGARELARQALDATAADHHWWPLRAALLARCAAELARLGGPDAGPARTEAITTYAALAASPVTDAHERINAERQQAELAAEAADPAARLAALNRAVRRIPAAVSRSESDLRRLSVLANVGGLASEAAAAAIAADDLDAAVELLEHGRGLLFNEARGIRAGWAQLRAVDPRLAAELDRVEQELSEADLYTHVSKFSITVGLKESATSGEDPEAVTTEWDPRPEWSRRTRELATERARLLDRIRLLPGFADLLRPPSLPVLRERLGGLPIVMLNTHGDQGDALLIPAEPDRPVEHVRLPELRETALRRQVTLMYAAVLDATNPAVPLDRRVRAQEDLLGVLAWLWDAVTGPVLDRIAAVGGPPPRIWWCPVGTLARLPLHAAGHHGEAGRPRTALDRAVSSYTPTLTSLAHAVAEQPLRPTTPTALIVGVPDAERSAALPEVRAEVEQVARLIPGSALLTGERVAPDAVRQLLRVHPIAHFACHGRADTSISSGLRSGLDLGDSATLSSHMVRSYRLAQPELAFLSACSTAETHPTFTDEPLNLASAFQLAGFRGVIGTMWPTTDSARIARSFYAALTTDGTAPPETAAAAQALTDTARAVRDEFPTTPTRWAGYVHVGVNQPLSTTDVRT